MKYPFPELVKLSSQYPKLIERALEVGKLDNSHMWIQLPDGFDFQGNNIEGVNLPVYIPPEPLQEPTVFDLTINFSKAVSKWGQAGFPVVSEEEYNNRSSICEGCEHWEGKARLGLGKCNVPNCGCTKFKRWLSTERCPINKWV